MQNDVLYECISEDTLERLNSDGLTH
ncbi:protein of unknown function [Pararobbsia alpina]